MTKPGRRKGRPNPFYVLLVTASVAFAVTSLGYLVSPTVLERATAGAGSRALAAWLDRHGSAALAVEFALMLVTAILAMATDHWFHPIDKRAGGPPGSDGA